ncbi:MAG: glycosyltransferase [Microcoleaceae cyanobacterium]
MGISIMEQAGSSAIIITGMHRSGTSLTASLLQRLGVNIGEHLIESDAGNIRGHFENADFVQYHQSVLQANGFDRLGCVVQPRPVQLTDDQIKAAQNLILRNQTQVLWGWKDPRTTLFLELWRQLIPISYYVFVYRSPWEVVDSFYRRATDAEILEHPEVAIEMWLHYNREILNFYQQNFPQCVLVNVRTVGETPQEFINELNRRFNLNLPPAPTDNFEPDLLEDEVLETPRPQLIKQCFPEAIDLYLQLEATAADLAGGLLPAEARILNHSPSLLWMFRDWSEVRRLEKDVKTWQDQFQLSVDRLVEAETELGRTQFRYESLEVKQEESAAKLLNLETELGETQLQLAGKETQLEAAAQKLSTLEAELGTAQLQRDGTQNNFQAALTKITALEEELGKSQRQLEDTEVYRQEAEVRVAQADTQLGQAELRILELEEQLEASQVAQQQAEARAQMLELPLQQAQEEIQAIKSSKIWRLRDRWHDTKQSLRRTVRARYIHHLDTPTTWEFVGNGETYTQIEGWCLYTGERTHTQVRACLGSEVTTGVYGIERLDVGQLYGWIPGSSQAGFRVQVQLPAGDHQLHLELQDNQGRWHRFASYPVKVSSLRAAFDAPVNWRHRQGEILFAGWCCHLTAQISQLTLECRNGAANRSVNCAYGLRRSDVGEVLPDWTGSSNSGFEALLELEAGRWQVSLAAQLETGETVTYRATEQLVVSREGALTQGTAKLRQLSDFTGAIRKRAAERKQRLGRLVPTPAEIPAVLRQMWQMYRQTQSPVDQAQLPEGFELLKPIEPYDAWLAVNQWTNRSQAFLQKRLAAWDTTRLPKISVVMPVYNPPIEFLEQAIISVTQQIYTNWELCIADDCSTDPAVGETLNRWAEQDQRIQVLFRSENGNISRASNTAAKQATGDFLLFLDNDDELTPNALAEVALHLAANPGTDVLYSDDDKIDPIGKRFAPQFKPKWSPELLLSYMYMGHVLVVRRQLFQQVSGFRAGYEGAQDYDLALRITEEARQIGHIPLVLYHWRTAPGSTAISGAAKPASFQAGCNAVQDALDRRQTQGTAAQPAWAVEQSLGIFAHQFPHTGPSVTIIIPTRNQLKLLTACVESLKKTTYENYQILIIDNDSDDRATLEYLAEISRDFTENSTEDSAENSQSGSSENSQASVQNVPTVKVLNIKSQGKFNFAAINNQAAQQTDTDYLLFLNNDTEVLEENWLSQMMGYAQLDRVGAVGARLIFPDNHIQHAGILHGLHHGLAGHAFKLSRKDYFGYLAYSKVARNYSAVTAACLLTPRKLFLELGGFDAENFAVAYNDADYGYRLHLQGYRSVYCADAELLHREGTSRGFKDDPAEVARFRRKYADKVDPYYSPHLSLANEWFQIQPRRLTLSDRVSKQTVKIKPKVLMCSNALEYTGAPLHQYEIALQLAAQGEIEPVIFCTDDGPLRQAYEQAGIPVIVREHPLINLYQRQQYETALEQYVSLLNLKQYDVVYANTLENFFMVDCAHRCQVPVIWNVHESEAWQSYFNRFGSEIAACALECFRYPYRIIFVADATRNLYQPLNSHHNFITIHNGLDINRFHLTGNLWTRSTARSSLNLQESEVVILLLGTVCERKGQHD